MSDTHAGAPLRTLCAASSRRRAKLIHKVPIFQESEVGAEGVVSNDACHSVLMKRSHFRLAQFIFDTRNRAHLLSKSPSFPVRFAARITSRLVLAPLLKTFGANRLVSAQMYGRRFVIPAEHPLPMILMIWPQCNRGLGLAAEVVASASASRPQRAMIDVGANVGETVAIVESYSPSRYVYLCIEPDADIAELCRLNYRDASQVQVQRCFVGECEGMTVRLQDDGRANPSTVLVERGDGDSEPKGKLSRLDTVARGFATQYGGVDLIKVDTEGYDFSVLRSAENLLKDYHPAIYFEWYPTLLSQLGESISGGFTYLAQLGYHHFVFFTSPGNYYCRVSDPDELLLRSLAAVATADPSIQYFDVFASTDLKLCDELVEKSIQALRSGGPVTLLPSAHKAIAQQSGAVPGTS